MQLFSAHPPTKSRLRKRTGAGEGVRRPMQVMDRLRDERPGWRRGPQAVGRRICIGLLAKGILSAAAGASIRPVKKHAPKPPLTSFRRLIGGTASSSCYGSKDNQRIPPIEKTATSHPRRRDFTSEFPSRSGCRAASHRSGAAPETRPWKPVPAEYSTPAHPAFPGGEAFPPP